MFAALGIVVSVGIFVSVGIAELSRVLQSSLAMAVALAGHPPRDTRRPPDRARLRVPDDGARLTPAGEVALITLLEVVVGPRWMWLFLSEQPAVATIVGGLVVLGAGLVQAAQKPETPLAPV